KYKVAPPFKVASVDIVYGKGVSKTGEIVDIASELEIIKKAGAWYSYEGEKIGQGRENAKEYLETHPEINLEIEKKIREHYNLK
ncbi:MAG: DNA recombination/repair protein RecA, partial [Paracholeplasma sp.]|nr:DNA recombination/repair protein RecA [Paracholeplasma sp.]